jgi:choline dehydrogenase-like flavoprotein
VTTPTYVVVGSGPSGVAAASALLDRGVPVTMLDVGVECEPDRTAVVRAMSLVEPERWSQADRDRIAPPPSGGRLLPLKRAFGSDFPYATGELEATTQDGTSCLMSYARGGLSNVWGGAVLPNVREDLADWPVSPEALAPHYASVAELMPIASAHDELERIFPFYTAPSAPLRPSRLAASLLARMRGHRQELESAGFVFGQSRLAVSTEDTDKSKGCRYTGLCLSGCPYLAIWNAAAALDRLCTRPNFTYRSGVLVQRVEPLPDGVVRVHTNTREGLRADEIIGRRVLLAGGPLSTTRIVIDSLRLYDRPLTLQFQPYFLLPMLAYDNAGDVESERIHTLAQIFVEVRDQRVSPHPVHLQVYTFNEFMRARANRVAALFGPFSGFVRGPLLGRLLAIQGYLHSSEAPSIIVTAKPDPARGRARLALTAQRDARVRRVIKQVVRKLRIHRRSIGAVPLSSMITIGRPGDGNHVGGVFPIRRYPSELETDLTGQLSRLPGVHLVDSTTLPSLAATTFTYTTMAHAHRIADSVALTRQ